MQKVARSNHYFVELLEIANFLNSTRVGSSAPFGITFLLEMGQHHSRGEPPRPSDPEELGKTIVIVSDTHGAHRQIPLESIPDDADILIHAGDFTSFGRREDAEDFNAWLGEIRHVKHKVVVNGNHESNAEWRAETRDILSNATFLKNESAEIDGVRIFGKDFYWNMETPNPYDELIPTEGVDVLIAHNPAKGLVDGGHGCVSSVETVKRVQPRLFVCGHIHSAGRTVMSGAEAGEKHSELGSTIFVNGAMVGEKRDEIVGEPVVVRM